MANIERIKTDESKEIQGVWEDYILGIRVKVARDLNSKYREELRNLIDPDKGEYRKEKISIEAFTKITNIVRARTILLGWENIDDSNNKPITYSAIQSEKFFADPELKDFCAFVVAISKDQDKYAKEVLEESAKN